MVWKQALQNRPALLERLGKSLQGLPGGDNPLAMLVVEASFRGTAGEALTTRLLAITSTESHVTSDQLRHTHMPSLRVNSHLAPLALGAGMRRRYPLGGGRAVCLCAIIGVR